MPSRPTRLAALPLLAASLALLAGCRRDEVTHYRVPKGAPAGAAATGAAHAAPAVPPPGMPPPGMQGDVPQPPAPEARLAWILPKGWKDARQGGMRYATLTPPVPGKVDASVVVLPGPAGGELPNVNRWRKQIDLPPIDEAQLAASRRVLDSKAGRLSLYDFSSQGGAPRRVVAGLLEAGGSTWFVKLSGDAGAVSAARPDFLRLLESLRLE